MLLTVDGDQVAEIGEFAALIDDDDQAAAMINMALAAPGMAVIDSLVADERRLGYAATDEGARCRIRNRMTVRSVEDRT